MINLKNIFSIENDLKTCCKKIIIFGKVFNIKSKKLIIKNFAYKKLQRNNLDINDIKLYEKKEKENIKIAKKYLKDAKIKYVHLIYNEKFTKPFVDFINAQFNPKEHLFLCNFVKEDTKTYPLPQGENVFIYENYLNGFLYCLGINLNQKKYEKIFLHSLFFAQSQLLPYLYKNNHVLSKAYWVIWGNDLYNAQRDEMNDYVRKNFKGYITNCDNEVLKERYNITTDQKCYDASYVFPITKEMLDKVPARQTDCIRIQINNSCDKSTLDVIDMLSKYKDENVNFSTILSYGKMEFKDQIIEKGAAVFGSKFEYLDEMVSPQEYTNFLSQNNILILNQDRQQGFGNTIASLALGTKVFIKKDVSTNQYLKDHGMQIFNTEDIANLSFDDFISYNNYNDTKNNALKFFDEEYLAQGWRSIFDAE